MKRTAKRTFRAALAARTPPATGLCPATVRPRAEAPGGLKTPPPDREDGGKDRKDADQKRRDGGGGGRDEPPSGEHHPLIQGLLITLPQPGSEWDMDARKSWLAMANCTIPLRLEIAANFRPIRQHAQAYHQPRSHGSSEGHRRHFERRKIRRVLSPDHHQTTNRA